MGWAKYWEDNKRIVDERLFRPEPVQKPVTAYFDCPYCSHSYTKKEELYSHIKNNHNLSRPILVINGSIVSKSEKLFVSEVQEAVIHLYGLTVDLEINGVENRISDNSHDIKAQLVLNTNEIYIGDTHYTITLMRSLEVSNPVVNRVAEHWQKDVALGKHIAKDYGKSFNIAEISYLNGIFDYLIACVATPNEKKDLYESAYSILSGFSPSTPLANTILKIIAFRFNWLSELRSLCNHTDSSRILIDFYVNNPNKGGTLTYNSMVSEQEPKVFIEDDLLDCMNAIISYLNDDMISVDYYLSNTEVDKISDSNLRDKILLLLARKSIRAGEAKKARRYYEGIKSPFIECEKNGFMDKYYSNVEV